MKKIFMAAALIFSVAVIQFIAIPQAEAREVYAASETRGGKTSDYYIITESIQRTNYGVKVRLHAVGRNFSENEYWEVGFTKKSDGLYAVLLPSSYTTQVTRGTEYVVDKMYFNIFIAVVQNS